MGHARQLRRHPHRLPAARRAPRLDRRPAGLRPDRRVPLRLGRVPHLLAQRPRRRAASATAARRWSVPAITTGYTGPIAGWARCRDRRAVDALPGVRRSWKSCARSSTAWPRGSTRSTAAAGADRVWSAGFQFGDWLDPTAPAEPAGSRRRPTRRSSPPPTSPAPPGSSPTPPRSSAAEDARPLRRARRRGRARRSPASTSHAPGRMLSDSATAYALALVFDLIADPAARQPRRRPARRDRRAATATGSPPASSAPR